MPRSVLDRQTSCNDWEKKFGTTAIGNLPQYKLGQDLCGVNIDNIVYPGVKVDDFRVYHRKCPYSTQATSHLVRNMDLNSPDYFKLNIDVSGSLSDHADTNGIMIRNSRGPVHGWLCVDENCNYYTSNNQRYFHR